MILKKWHLLCSLLCMTMTTIYSMDVTTVNECLPSTEEDPYSYRRIRHNIAAFSPHIEYLDNAIIDRWHQLADHAYREFSQNDKKMQSWRDLPQNSKIALYNKAYREILKNNYKLLMRFLKHKESECRSNNSIQEKNHWFDQLKESCEDSTLTALKSGNISLFIFYIKNFLDDWFFAKRMSEDWLLSKALIIAKGINNPRLVNGIKYSKEKAGYSKSSGNTIELNFSMRLYMYDKNMKEHEEENSQILCTCLDDRDTANSLTLTSLNDAYGIAKKKNNENLCNKIALILDKKEKWQW